MKKSIALIGGSGFIGTNLTIFFLENGYSVISIDKNPNSNYTFSSDHYEERLLDVNKTSLLIDYTKDTENVIWLVSDLIPATSMDSLVDDFIFNINPLIKFLEHAKTLRKLRKFIFISSGGAIYGNSFNNNKFKEDYPKNPVSAYGLSKLIAESYIHFLSKDDLFNRIVLRPSNVYGKFQNLVRPQGIVGVAFKSIQDKKPIELYSRGQIVRDFIHVVDLAKAIKSCIESKIEMSNFEIFNVGSGVGISISEILDLVNFISKSQIETIIKPARSVDSNYSVLDTTLIKAALNWQPTITLNDGLADVWDWMQKLN